MLAKNAKKGPYGCIQSWSWQHVHWQSVNHPASLPALVLCVHSAGGAISLFSDFLGDTRFGFCYGIFLADRNRCCGGSENVDFLLETCLGESWKDRHQRQSTVGNHFLSDTEDTNISNSCASSYSFVFLLTSTLPTHSVPGGYNNWVIWRIVDCVRVCVSIHII